MTDDAGGAIAEGVPAEVARVMALDLNERAAEFALIAERFAVELVRADSGDVSRDAG